MARSPRTNTIGSILQTVGRALQSNPSKSRRRAPRTAARPPRGRATRPPRRRTPTSGKGLLRRLLG